MTKEQLEAEVGVEGMEEVVQWIDLNNKLFNFKKSDTQKNQKYIQVEELHTELQVPYMAKEQVEVEGMEMEMDLVVVETKQ